MKLKVTKELTQKLFLLFYTAPELSLRRNILSHIIPVCFGLDCYIFYFCIIPNVPHFFNAQFSFMTESCVVEDILLCGLVTQ